MVHWPSAEPPRAGGTVEGQTRASRRSRRRPGTPTQAPSHPTRRPMRIAITGTRGTLGTALEAQARAAGHDILALNRPDHDLTDLAALERSIGDFGPTVVLHPAAYTDVDGCERNPDLAYAVNALGTRNLALV